MKKLASDHVAKFHSDRSRDHEKRIAKKENICSKI